MPRGAAAQPAEADAAAWLFDDAAFQLVPHEKKNADKTKTFCVYEGPSEAAVRQAAELNGLPVDSVMEVEDVYAPL